MINPTTRVTVKRGTTTESEFGDKVSSETVVYTNVPATLLPKTVDRIYKAGVEQRWTKTNYYDVYVTGMATLQVKDILIDHLGTRYVVDSVTVGGSFVLPGQNAVCSRIA
jgi:hypothetical protein